MGPVNIHTIKPIILRYLRDELREGDLALLETWRLESPANQTLLDELEDPARVGQVFARIGAWQKEPSWERVHEYIRQRKEEEMGTTDGSRRLYFLRWMAAAVLLLLLGAGTWWFVQNRPHTNPATVETAKVHDVAAPVTNRATITLGNGQQLFLDSAGNGALAQQGSARVIKQGNGQIAYQAAPLEHGELLYNTLTNPRGSQVIALTLTDGTRVWLNAESTLKYPAVFTGQDRTVAITGEAYLEVAADAGKPFKVTAAGETVTVLGTSFNINAYANENRQRTTLITGAIVVSAEGARRQLQPGQQVTVTPGKPGMEVASNADLDQILAWKNGAINFNGLDLEQAMRQLERWYDIEVVYERGVPAVHLWGELGRNVSLKSLLKGLEESKLHFRIEEGRRLVVLP